jgi:hypothetical protein
MKMGVFWDVLPCRPSLVDLSDISGELAAFFYLGDG